MKLSIATIALGATAALAAPLAMNTDCHNHLSAQPTTHALNDSPTAQACMQIAETLATSVFFLGKKSFLSAAEDTIKHRELAVQAHMLETMRASWGIPTEAIKGVDVERMIAKLLHDSMLEQVRISQEFHQEDAAKEENGKEEMEERSHGECIPGFSWGC